MAYIERRPGGWRAQVRRKGSPSISRTFDLRADAEAWAQEIERELRRGNNSIVQAFGRQITFEEVAKHYATHALPSLKSEKTARSFLQQSQQKFGKTLVTAIRPTEVSKWRDEMAKAGASARSIVYALSMLSAALNYAARELSIPLPAGNPVQLVRKPALPNGRDRRLREGELDALLSAARVSTVRGLEQIIILAIETSMRLGELLSLTWEHVDLNSRTAHLPVTKNGSSRTVALSKQAVTALSELKASKATKLAKPAKPSKLAKTTKQTKSRMPGKSSDHVFHWTASNTFEKTWRHCKSRAQAAHLARCTARQIKPDPRFLADLRFHDLRHEAASRLFEKGLGIMEVASMTGHQSLSMLKRYTHVDASRLAQKLG